MERFDIRTALSTLGKLEISESTTAEEAGAAMKALADFNQCMMGLVNFSGRTPWERHPDDELLHILEGEVDITLLLVDGGERHITLHAGSVFIVPAHLWHNQYSRSGTKLLFVTSQQGNEESTEEDPRQQ
ncbi:MAG: cupin domain-containing protein [Alcanivorax sp.]|nr:cupin domain-containing protein [Alcanivorax sp.]